MPDQGLGTGRDNSLMRLVYFTFHILGIAGGEVGMRHGMIGDIMTFRHKTPNEFGVILHV
ncbi:hypothetical protein GCM10008012_56330 [Rhizobium anhuiense]|nr:hypothetical protein GCM10008012_56330 [Rhizobium anhuiense]